MWLYYTISQYLNLHTFPLLPYLFVTGLDRSRKKFILSEFQLNLSRFLYNNSIQYRITECSHVYMHWIIWGAVGKSSEVERLDPCLQGVHTPVKEIKLVNMKQLNSNTKTVYNKSVKLNIIKHHNYMVQTVILIGRTHQS